MTQRPNIFRRTKYFYTYDKIYFTLPSSSVLISPSLSLSKSAKASLRHSISLAPICLSGLDQSEMSIGLCLDQWEVTWPGPPWRQLITPRTRPPLLASVLAIVTPHSNIAVVLLSNIYNIYYIYIYVDIVDIIDCTTHSRTRTRTPSADKISKFSYFTPKQNIKQLHRRRHHIIRHSGCSAVLSSSII